MKTKFISNSLEETQKIARDFVDSIPLCRTSGATRAIVVGLYGDLGAGKTTFAQAVAKTLGAEEKVLSPTFVIMKIYELQKYNLDDISSKLYSSKLLTLNSNFHHLIHIDAYRIDHSSELLHLGWHDIISDPKNLILIEWPKRLANIMPAHIKINIKALENQNSREINITLY